MSDGKEVKRWLIFDVANRTFNFDEDQEMVLASDHDRIVAELKAGTANALKRVFNRQIGFLVSANAFRVLCEEIEKYDPFFKMPNSSERRRFVADRNVEMQNLKEIIARQAKVIEKLKGMVSHYETCATVDRYDDEKVPCDCGLEIELAAIEKQGEGM